MSRKKYLEWNAERSLHRLFRKWQEKNRALNTLYSTDLLLVESHLLLELESAPETSPQQFCELFELNRSSITRMIGRLKRRTLLRSVQARRKSRLLLTPHARATIGKIDRSADSLLKHFCRSLSSREIATLCNFINKLCDGYHHPRGAARPGEHPLRLPQRRVARCLGLTRTSFLASGVAVSHWHALSEMAESPIALTPSELASRLALQQPVLSTILMTLRRRGCIRYEDSKTDRRSVRIQITARGIAMYARIEAAGAKKVRSALDGFAAREIPQFIKLMSRLLDVPAALSPLIVNGYRVEAIEDEAALQESRRRWLTAPKSSRDPLPVPPYLFCEKVAPLGLYQGSILKGALQREKREHETYVSAWWTEASEQIAQEFLRIGSGLL